MESQPRNTETDTHCPSGWARGMRSFRGFVSFLLVIALLVLLALLLLKDNLNDQIRSVVELQLSRMLRDTDVSVTVQQAEFRRGKGIRVRGIHLVDGEQPLLSIEEINVQTAAEIWELVDNGFSPQAIEIRGLKLHVRETADAGTNLQALLARIHLPKKQPPPKVPLIHVKDCEVFFSLIGNSAGPLNVRINELGLEAKSDQQLFATATMSSEFFKALNVSAEYGLQSGEYRLWGAVRKMIVSGDLQQRLPAKVQNRAQWLNAIEARVDLDFEYSGTTREQRPGEFILAGKILEGTIDDQRLPFPVTGLTADFAADNTGIKFENVLASSLLGEMQLDFTTETLGPQGPFELVAKVDPLMLDQRLIQRLPPDAREFLEKFSPNGNIKLNAKLGFRDGRWIPDVVVDLQDISFAFHKFPYPLKNASGKITLDEEKIRIDMQAEASGKRVKLDGEFLDPGPNSHGQLRVVMDGMIPIDARVLVAMEKMPEIWKLTQKFHPRGRFGFQGTIQRIRKSDGRIVEAFRHRVNVEDVEFKYDLVPIPFENVKGTFIISETGTSFQGFRGMHVNSRNYAQGSWDPVNGLNLTIDSYDVELGDSLKSALPPAARNFWDGLRPRGTLQSVRSRLWAPPQQPIRYEFQVRHQPEDADDQRSISVFPVWFPYELKNLHIDCVLQPNRFQVRRLRGEHRKSALTVSGDGTFGADGWECHFRRLNFDRLVADREFTSALPDSLGKTIDGFDVQGLINLNGWLSFQQSFGRGGNRRYLGGDREVTPGNEIRTSWDLTADVDRGALVCGVALQEIFGAVRLTGTAQGERFESLGGMEIDSLVWNDIQFRKIRSPVYLDNDVALLGLWATAKQKNVKAEPLTAILFGGRLAANAQFSLHGNQPFQIQATLNQGDLQEFTFEVAPGYNDVAGKAFAGVRVTGDKTGTHALRGEGQVRMVDAKISEIPVMLGMLKLLSVRQVDRTLFNESKMDFSIKGEHIYFDNLEFLGDAISIKGNGEMDFDQNLDLQFYTAVGRDGFRIPVISPLLGMASQQILVIDVKGTTQEPKIKKNFFKILNGRLKENLEDLEDSIDSGKRKIIQTAEAPFRATR